MQRIFSFLKSIIIKIEISCIYDFMQNNNAIFMLILFISILS